MAKTTYYVIDGVKYRQFEWMSMSLRDMVAIRRETGYSSNELLRLLAELNEMPFEDLFNSPEHMLAFGSLIWLSRRAVDPKISFQDAIDFPLYQMEMVTEGEDEPTPDPTKPGSEPDAG